MTHVDDDMAHEHDDDVAELHSQLQNATPIPRRPSTDQLRGRATPDTAGSSRTGDEEDLMLLGDGAPEQCALLCCVCSMLRTTASHGRAFAFVRMRVHTDLDFTEAPITPVQRIPSPNGNGTGAGANGSSSDLRSSNGSAGSPNPNGEVEDGLGPLNGKSRVCCVHSVHELTPKPWRCSLLVCCALVCVCQRLPAPQQTHNQNPTPNIAASPRTMATELGKIRKVLHRVLNKIDRTGPKRGRDRRKSKSENNMMMLVTQETLGEDLNEAMLDQQAVDNSLKAADSMFLEQQLNAKTRALAEAMEVVELCEQKQTEVCGSGGGGGDWS